MGALQPDKHVWSCQSCSCKPRQALDVCAELLPGILLPAAGCILCRCLAICCSLCAGAWKRGRSRAAPDTAAGESDALERVHRRLRGLLNRLTEENMQV